MFKEKQYFSSLIFSHPLIEEPKDLLGTILLGSFETGENIEHGKHPFMHLLHCSKKPYKMTAEEAKAIDLFKKKKKPNIRDMGGHEEFLYDCYLKTIASNSHSQPQIMFCAPIRQILKEVIDSDANKLKSEKVTFFRLKILEFCKYIKNHRELGMRIKRINMQISDAYDASRVALYGNDVLRSKIYGTLKDLATPTSLQIFYKNEHEQEVVFNADGAGNWSFYLRVQKDIHLFAEAFRVLGKAGFLKDTYNDPRRRESQQENP
jgi:hypothetical protein